MGSLLQTSLQGMPLFPISALTVTLHLLSAAALPIFQQEPAIFRGPSIDIIKGEDYEDPSVERVSLFGDRDDVQGGDQPMEYYENMPRRELSSLLVSKLRDAWTQVNSLLFCSRLPMCAARLHMYNTEGMRSNHRLTNSLRSARQKITKILKRIEGSKVNGPPTRQSFASIKIRH